MRGVVNVCHVVLATVVEGSSRSNVLWGVARFPRKRIMGWRARALVAFIVRLCEGGGEVLFVGKLAVRQSVVCAESQSQSS